MNNRKEAQLTEAEEDALSAVVRGVLHGDFESAHDGSLDTLLDRYAARFDLRRVEVNAKTGSGVEGWFWDMIEAGCNLVGEDNLGGEDKPAHAVSPVLRVSALLLGYRGMARDDGPQATSLLCSTYLAREAGYAKTKIPRFVA